MATDHPAVKVRPNSELGLTLKAASRSGQPVLIDTGDDIYTLVVTQGGDAPEDPLAHYDPEVANAGLRALRGAFVGVDRNRLLRDLREQREQDSADRPNQCPT